LTYSIPRANGNVNDAYDYVLNLKALPFETTNINNALLEALNLASEVRRNEEIEYYNTQQMIVFLTDGKATASETSTEKIITNIANIQEKNSGRYMVPIYGLAFGQDADFNLLKHISDKNGGFVRRIYESENSYEQLEDFYDQISKPKLRGVSFEYEVNEEKIPCHQLTTTELGQAFGSNEYCIAGSYPSNEEIEYIEITMKSKFNIPEFISFKRCGSTLSSPRPLSNLRCIPQSDSSAITFPGKNLNKDTIQRLWALKRIRYLLNEKKNCKDETNEVDSYHEEALKLALEYNFVTDLTSLVIEENDDYIKSGPVEVNENLKHNETTKPPIAIVLSPQAKCKMIMYDQTYFRGKFEEVQENINDFKSINFDNNIASVKVEGKKGKCCWTLFADKDFAGASIELFPGEYKSSTQIADVFKKASSAKLRKRC
jgi:hypothetical protein